MKHIKEVKKSKQHKVIVNPELDKYDDMPVFQNKLDMAAAFLEKHPLPESLMQDIKSKRIQYLFEQNMSVEQMAQRLSLTKSEILLNLQKLGLMATLE